MKHLFIFILIFWGASVSSQAAAQTILDAAKTASMIKKDPSVQLIDLRTQGEINQTGKIQGAIWINYHAPDFEAQLSKLNKTKPVLLYCAAGGRSGQASARLVKMGFEKVYDYAGGMTDWKAKGYKTVR